MTWAKGYNPADYQFKSKWIGCNRSTFRKGTSEQDVVGFFWDFTSYSYTISVPTMKESSV
ncbi:hypothetical protein K443DRAFT_677161 [Laccaria amethystina LaAM-08-1]|uniref:Uncharacterized protein n=1 Tax=Laccaria amethystina LaAM-08-1 TaxID=1095629 RepID=A0A0C9Y4K6_9AGAR|nr:hypothetical protein K443DRAFT_677161 [Laccaria amethystina LaAM-08-1]